jgi:hypothetical protein
MKNLRAYSCSTLLVGLVALAIPALAGAQATRTWVSGVGDDANPCSRTAPCKTFAGTISKTATGGEINCLDPGGFGIVTINKSITIKCRFTEGGIVAAGSNGIVINAAATSNVVLEGLDINGLGTGQDGIRVLQAKSVKVLDSEIYGFSRRGIDFEASNNGAKLLVADSHIFDNAGPGILVAPPSGGNSTATARTNLIAGNGCGIAATNHLADPAFNFTANCGTQLAGVGGAAKVNAFDNVISDSDATAGASGSTGVFANGASTSVRIGNNMIEGNNNGIRAIDPGAFGGIFTFGDNYLVGNVTNGTPKGTIAKQ